MKALCEMDREYELREAKAATIKENHLKLINGLIGLGYSKQSIQSTIKQLNSAKGNGRTTETTWMTV